MKKRASRTLREWNRHSRLMEATRRFFDEYYSEACTLSIREAEKANPELGRRIGQLYLELEKSQQTRRNV